MPIRSLITGQCRGWVWRRCAWKELASASVASCALFIADRLGFDRVKLLVSDLSLESVECWEVETSIGSSAM